ncbi:MAG: hypothetical protein V4726_11110 [Verrucomicrobiota bacterium]
MKVFKYPLPGRLNLLSVPFGWRALCLAIQHNEPQIWLEVDPDAPRQQVEVHMVGTGGEVPPGSTHVGTILTDGGNYVWHYYARTTSIQFNIRLDDSAMARAVGRMTRAVETIKALSPPAVRG